MPKEKLQISEFNYGIIRNVDVKDIPLNAASDSQNIETITESGLLKGIPASTTVSGISSSIKKSVWLSNSQETVKSLVYWDGSAIRVIEDFYGTKTAINTGITTAVKPSMIVSNNRVYIGTGIETYEVGYRVNSQLSTSVTSVSADQDYLLVEGIPQSSASYVVGITASNDTKHTSKTVQEYNGNLAIQHTSHGISGLGAVVDVHMTFRSTGSATSMRGRITEIPSADLFVLSIEWNPPTNIPNGTRQFDILYNSTVDYTLIGASGNFSITQTSPSSLVVKTGAIDTQKYYDLPNGLVVGFLQKEGYTTSQSWTITSTISASETLYAQNAKLSYLKDSIGSLTNKFTGSGENFVSGKSYFYTHSFIYNNLEESPLAIDYAARFTIEDSATSNILTLALDSSELDTRITGINIYVASGEANATSPNEEYRLLKSISLVGGAWRVSGTTATTKIIDDGIRRTTYSENTGIYETESDLHVGYKVGAVVNNELFVGDCYQEGLSTDAANMIFKSKPFRYNVFDWSNEYLKLPDTPIAMVGFEGRLYIFMRNTIYRINPDGFFVEDIINNIGIINSDALVITDSGLYWSDDTNAYSLSQGKINPISFPINYSVQNWHGQSYSYHFVGFDSSRYAIMFCFASSTQIVVWTYNTILTRWDKYVLPITNAYSIFTGVEGEVYIGTSTSPKELFSSSSELAWYWISKNEDFGDNTQSKIFYKIDVLSEGTVVIYYSIDDETFQSITSGADIQSAGAWREGARLKLKFDCPSGVGKVRDVRVVYRNKVGVL